MNKNTLYILIVLVAGFIIGQTTMYYYTVKPMNEIVKVAVEKVTYANSNDFGKIKVKKDGAIDLNVVSEISTTADSLKETTKKGFLNSIFKRKRK